MTRQPGPDRPEALVVKPDNPAQDSPISVPQAVGLGAVVHAFRVTSRRADYHPPIDSACLIRNLLRPS